MTPIRFVPVFALLLALVLPASQLAAQPIDPKSLVLTQAEIGGTWQFIEESGPAPARITYGDGTSEDLGMFYEAVFGNTANPRIATIVVFVTPNEAETARLTDVERQYFEQVGWTCSPEAMGDGPGFHCSISRDSRGLTGEKFLFRVRNVIAETSVYGPEGQSGQESLAHDIGVLQEAKLRRLLQPSPPSPPSTPPGPAYCEAGKQPEFAFGFAALKAKLGDKMGNPIECEHTNADNGDSLMQTTTGLAFYRKSTNTPTFTNGFEHWALTARGFVYWTGESIDPPANATPVP